MIVVRLILDALFGDSLERSVPEEVARLIVLVPSILAGLLVYIPLARWRRRFGEKKEAL